MKFLPLVWRNLMRRKVRTIFTALSILVAFVLFGALMAIRGGFSLGIELAGADRLVMIHKVSFIQPLPIAYGARIAATSGVTAVTHASWFGGIYQDERNFFANMAVEPESFLEMYPEYVLPEDQKKTWLADRTGAIVGRALVERFGWKIGDRIPLQAPIWRKPDGSAWEFTIDGIYDSGKQGTDITQMFFHYDYLNETRDEEARDIVGWYTIRVADPSGAANLADRIDAQFANSAAETKTSTEKAFVQAFANQIGDIGAIMIAILVTVLFTILLVSGNTMAQSIRERTNELAVLKTLGFTDRHVLGLVLLESLLLAVVAGLLGLGVAWLIILQGDPTGGLLPAFYLPTRDIVIGIILIVALGLVAGALPAWRAGQLKIVDALRQQG
ncbi:MAG: FtsX-like permease family protein [Luteitalea sp.]|nr:FtsX-like permease family protein [Luteitalea sp.]